MSSSTQEGHDASAERSKPPRTTAKEAAATGGGSSGSPPPPKEPPPPPNPAADPRFSVHEQSPFGSPPPTQSAHALGDDIFSISPSVAVKLLGAGVEALVRMTGDIPPSPAPANPPEMPHMRGMEAEKQNIVRSHSERSLARMRQEAEAAGAVALRASISSPPPAAPAAEQPIGQGQQGQQEQQGSSSPSPSSAPGPIDGVFLRAPTPLASGLGPPPPTPEPYTVVGANQQPVNVQHSWITRKFYSKKPPPIGITDYLLRLHRFCPASTAVYLATSLYIHRLAVDERAIAVTRRNAHRLLLAGLRVAMKALEDRCYPHARVAQVGGVSAAELARLEISFCFLAGFELIVGEEEMRRHWVVMRAPPPHARLHGMGPSSSSASPASSSAAAAPAAWGGGGSGEEGEGPSDGLELRLPRRPRK